MFQSRRGGPEYSTYMARVYESVSVAGQPNYQGERLQVPSNLPLKEWEALARNEEKGQLIEFLRYGFPVHQRHVATYVTTELKEGAMLGPY